MKKIYIKTWGCQSNIADSEQLEGSLKQNGYEIVQSMADADVVILNTCSVKLPTQNSELHFIKNMPKDKKLFVGGCLTKTLKLRSYSDNIDAIFDTNSILKVSKIIEEPRDLISEEKEKRINLPISRKDKEIAIINISQGCLSFCDFCATKLARGNLKSYRIGDIKREFENAIGNGCKRIYLSSQDNGCYGFDIKTNLPELLNELTSIKGDYIIRVGMMNPWHLTKILPDLIESYKSKKIMKFLHIPVQSGSEKILKHMKRIHTVENYKNAVKEFRKNFPEISIATDIIVGYPLETEEDFQLTYDLIKETKPEVLNISKFSSRPGTKAAELKQLLSEIIKERSVRLNDLYQKIRKEIVNHKFS